MLLWLDIIEVLNQKDSHEAWNSLQDSSKQVVRDLAAFLRVAEALDRSHKQVIKTLKVAVSYYGKNKKGKSSKGKSSPRTISLVPYVKKGENCLSEAWALGQKKTFFEQTFKVNLDILMDASAVLASATSGLDMS